MSTLKTINVVHPSSATNNIVLDNNGNMSVAGTLSPASPFTFRNRIINGDMSISQRATSATVTAGTARPGASIGYPSLDRWFVYSTGANITAAQVFSNSQARLQITGAAGVTAIGVGQRIEAINCFDLAGKSATLSVDISNSVLTTVTWRASYANTSDTFGTIGTPTKTQIATGTFTVNSTLTTYTATFAVPAAATTGIEILFTVGAQTSGTWIIRKVQLEEGTIATPFERRPFGLELHLCQRYYEQAPGPDLYLGGSNLTGVYTNVQYQVTKRATPTINTGTWSYFTSSGGSGTTAPDIQLVHTTRFSARMTGTALGGWVGSVNEWSAAAEIP